MKYTTQEVASVADYVSFVNEEKAKEERSGNNVDFLFRGQRRDLALIPRLARLQLKGSIKEIENLTRIFHKI